jgi:hypothetical protein
MECALHPRKISKTKPGQIRIRSGGLKNDISDVRLWEFNVLF